jgi:septum formation protein
MSTYSFWLASNSPRRREMISWLGWSFQSAPSNIDESIREGEQALDYVRRVAFEKSRTWIDGAVDNDIIIAADTVVVLDGEILGKPADAQNAVQMLKSLRNRPHQVATAISVRQVGSAVLVSDLCVSTVNMRDYSDKEIDDYVASGDPLDKAGSYAIQNPAFHPSVGFAGCFPSVMGMPLCHLERTLRKIEGYHQMDMAGICRKNIKYNCPITTRVMQGAQIG